MQNTVEQRKCCVLYYVNTMPVMVQVMLARLRLAGDIDFNAIAARAHGYVGADLQALAKEATAVAIRRTFADLETTLPENGGSSVERPSKVQGLQ